MVRNVGLWIKSHFKKNYKLTFCIIFSSVFWFVQFGMFDARKKQFSLFFSFSPALLLLDNTLKPILG